MKRNSMKWIVVMLLVGLFAAAAAIAGEQSITGTVQKTDAGIIISAEDGATYMVQGKDMTDMVGKTVMVTGTLEESESGKTLTIISVEEAQEKVQTE